MNHTSTWLSHEEVREALRKGRGRGVKIAVIDSGIELSHVAHAGLRLVDDLAFELTPEGVVRRVPGKGIDVFGHGTAVAHAIRRMAPEAQIGSFRVLNAALRSKFQIIKEAAVLAIERGYQILNCSFGSRADISKIEHFKPWVDLAYRRGVHIVSACDNENFRNPEWPGYFPSVITVNMANTESDDLFFRWDEPAGDFSRHLVEFAARGVDLHVPWKRGKWSKQTGSSFAAPHVAGLLARLLGEHGGVKPPVAKALLQEVALPWEAGIRVPNF
jgi:subtilisin family serine protease